MKIVFSLRRFFLLAAIVCSSSVAGAQTVNQNSGWLLLLNNTKISEKWGLYADVQLRSSDDYAFLRNLLVRPGVTYYLNSRNEFTLGYLFTQSYNNGPAEITLTEHRIWEQYVYKHKLKAVALAHRFRMEQRFIEQTAADVFAQRLRYFVRAIVPLKKGAESFTDGAFLALQNEVFLNVQGKDKLNGSLFDQNRVYGALGYRVSPKFDIEAGYMNQAIKGAANNTSNNIIQLAVYTKF